ncbi:MAG: rRNA maturation RNase YbeY [Patescibacteria group bacterium]
MTSTLDTRNFTKSPIPRFPYEEALQATLPGWDMSLAFAGRTRAQSMNIRLRGKDYVPNVLSYEAGPKSGEIVICLDEAKRQASEYGMTYAQFVGFLFIHGCFHLKGEQHGATMDRKERLLLKRLTSPSKTRSS